MINPVNIKKKKINFLLIGLSIIFALIGVWGIGNYLVSKNARKTSSIKEICNQCNIFLIDLDILRADALPCYGYFRNTAPNICALAKKSVIFSDNYSSSIWTLPSMFSTITSLYQPFHQVRETYTNILSPEIPTLAETLRNHGYKTAFVGEDNLRNGLLNDKNDGLRGYDLVTNDYIEKVLADLSQSSQPWFIHYYSAELHMPYLLRQGTRPIENLTAPKNLPITHDDFNLKFDNHLRKNYSKIFTKKAIKEYPQTILGTNKSDSTRISSLFYKLSKDLSTRNDYLIDIWRPIQNTYMDSFDKNSAADVAYVRMIYDSIILSLDKRLEKILDTVSTGSLSKNTITIITSDHGQAFGEHGTFGHDQNFHTELYSTPLIIHSPDWYTGVVNRSTSNIDIFPTVLSLLGLNIPDKLQGHSLTTYINNPSFDENLFIYSEDYNKGIILQNRRWLYFLPGDAISNNNSELYDKINDPLEKNNVAFKYKELTYSLFKEAMLYRSYDKVLENKGLFIPMYEKIRMDPVKMEKLRKEGYF